MGIRIKEVAFVFYPITDAARARRFYEGTLALKPGLQVEFAPGMWWIEYDIGGVALAICNAPMENAAGPGQASALALEVEDLDATKSALSAGGVPIVLDITEFAPCRMFIAADPDGNKLTFHQRKAAANA